MTGGLKDAATQAGRFERKIRSMAGLGRRSGETYVTAGQAPIIFDRQQHMRWPAAIGNEDRSAPRRLLGAASVLIKFTAGQGCHRHLNLRVVPSREGPCHACSNMWAHIYLQVP